MVEIRYRSGVQRQLATNRDREGVPDVQEPFMVECVPECTLRGEFDCREFCERLVQLKLFLGKELNSPINLKIDLKIIIAALM